MGHLNITNRQVVNGIIVNSFHSIRNCIYNKPNEGNVCKIFIEKKKEI